MSFDELQKDLEDLGDNLITVISDATDVAVAGYVATFLRRVQFKGENSNKRKLGTYARSTARIKQKKGQPSQFVNLTDTFEMLRSVDIKNKKVEEDQVTFSIGPDDKRRKNAKVTNTELLKIHEERYGPIMEPQDQELEEMIEVYEESIQALIDRY